MGSFVTGGAVLKCTFGAAPSSLLVLPSNNSQVLQPMASIMDSKPIVNIPPFGMCSSPANPTVATATAAAQGVLTPMPCVPVTAAPWAPGMPTVLVANFPALTSDCMATCQWGGVIQVSMPGQTPVNS